MHAKLLQSVRPFVTLRTVARQAPLCMGFSRQEYWSGMPRPPPGDLPDPGVKPVSLMFPASLMLPLGSLLPERVGLPRWCRGKELDYKHTYIYIHV